MTRLISGLLPISWHSAITMRSRVVGFERLDPLDEGGVTLLRGGLGGLVVLAELRRDVLDDLLGDLPGLGRDLLCGGLTARGVRLEGDADAVHVVSGVDRADLCGSDGRGAGLLDCGGHRGGAESECGGRGGGYAQVAGHVG